MFGSRYSSVSTSDEDTVSQCQYNHHDRRRRWWLILSNMFFCSTTFALLGVLCGMRNTPDDIFIFNKDIRKVSYWSPILDAVEVPVIDTQHDNTLWAHSIYATAPSPEVDAAWDELSTPRLLYVDADTIRRVGKDPEYAVHNPHDEDSYIATVAVLHQLHCLNSLRKNVFMDYYYPNGSSATLHMDHLQHCVDLLRQTLMCNADMGIITYNWWEMASDPVADFQVNMKCRNYDALSEYMHKPMEESRFFSIYEEGWIDRWHRVGGEKNVSAPREWWQNLVNIGEITQEEMDERWDS